MMKFNNLRHAPRLLTAALAALLAAAAGCTKVDDSVGSNLVPENQQIQAGYVTLPRKGETPKRYVATRLFRTDSIVSSNIAYGYMGAELNDTLGLRTAGFMTQYLDYMDDGVGAGAFGYEPFVDSARLELSIAQYGLDTLTPQAYRIYEIVSNAYMEDHPSDTTFYLNFDPRKYISEKPLFEFTFPDGETTGPATTSVPLKITPEGEDLIARLMLQKGTYKDDYSIYTGADSLKQWVEEFKGLCIRPVGAPAQPGKGTIYATTLSGTKLAIYGRNRVEEDPSLIKDTLELRYIFKHPYSSTYGNLSINTIEHDYAAGTQIDPSRIGEEGQRPLDGRVIVEGMGGVATELSFTKEFFDELEAEIAAANVGGKQFTTLAFSQARMRIYFAGSDYDWEKIDPLDAERLIYEMDAAPERIGLYTDYKLLSSISDYAYAYEKNNNLTLAYDGRVNRSRGCYTMDITGYMQALWNSYVEERDAAAAEGRAFEIANVKNRTIYAAPEAYGLYTTSFCVLQGMASEEGEAVRNAPIRFELMYNLVK
ncbi:MAG: DUF4270 domain-containing protein [Alistipes sp.]|nr:DUF4270 domain-containing protein [Alistipes senegalensis]MCM1251006.1 DUF4270 domain-containing protein [Alistipes sp.]